MVTETNCTFRCLKNIQEEFIFQAMKIWLLVFGLENPHVHGITASPGNRTQNLLALSDFSIDSPKTCSQD